MKITTILLLAIGVFYLSLLTHVTGILLF